MSDKTRWQRYNEEIQERIDFEQTYTNLGCTPKGNPGPDGWQSCQSHPAFGGQDGNPSASFNVKTGYYKDWRRGGKAISIYDLFVELEMADDWRDAQKQIAEHYGIKPPRVTKTHPEFGVVWQEWNDLQAKMYCKMKPPCTVEGLKKSGAKMCTRYQVPCFAWPIYDHLLNVVGWYFTPRNGQPFKEGQKSIAKKHEGAEAGFIGTPGVEWLAHHAGLSANDSMESEDQQIYWVEGGPDMVAGYSVVEGGLFVTNPNGCQEGLTLTQQTMLDSANVKLALVADADVPGLNGAFRRFEVLKDKGNMQSVQVFTPPFPISDKHGSDLRDFLVKPRTDAEKLTGNGLVSDLSKQMEPAKIQELKQKEEEQERKSDENKIDRSLKLLEDFGVVVTSRCPDGTVTLFSEANNNIRHGIKLSNFKYEDAAMLCGPKFMRKVSRRKIEGKIEYTSFLDAVIAASFSVQYETDDVVGAGIWTLKDEDGERTNDILLVKRGACYTVRGSKMIKQKLPVFGNVTADLSCKEDWFDANILADFLPRAVDPQWRQRVWMDLAKVIHTWKWAEGEQMATIAGGLVLATWMQTMWTWRPLVTLVGESNAGKTYFLEFLEDLYLGLANLSGGSTAAGVKQAIGYGGCPFLLDEFDAGKEQQILMKDFRVSSRGQKTLKGTADQTGKQYKIRHIPWLSGIFATSRRQADLNRMINLAVKTVPSNSIERPQPSQARELGHKLLAGILVTANRAIEIADRLGTTRGEQKIQTRYRESYAVPFAAIGAFLGEDIEPIESMMVDYLDQIVIPEVQNQEADSDQEDLLTQILSSSIRIGSDAPRERATVAELLFEDQFIPNRDSLEPEGISYFKPKHAKPRVAFAITQMVEGGVLSRCPEWANNPGARQVLERLNHGLDPKNDRQKIAGQLRRCVSIDFARLEDWAKRQGVFDNSN